MAKGHPRSMEELHVALQNSFQGIKQDIEDIRRTHAFLVNANKELADAIGKAHGAAVTTDQLNLLKIKVQDALDEARKASHAEKKLDSFIGRTDARFGALKEQFVRMSDFEKRAASLAARLDDLTSKTGKRLQTGEFNAFVDELNAEIGRLHSRVEGLEESGGRIVDTRIDELRRELALERRDVEQGAARLEKMQERFVLASSMQRAFEDINKEFDAIRQEMRRFRHGMDIAAAGRHSAGKSASLRKAASRNISASTSGDDDLDMEVIESGEEVGGKRQQRMLFFGNVLIALAFASLFISAGFTFFQKTPWDTYILWGGGIGFMVFGTLLRIIGIIQSRKRS